MVEIEVNTSSLSDMYYNPYLDGIGPAYCAPIDLINDAIQFIKELRWWKNTLRQLLNG